MGEIKLHRESDGEEEFSATKDKKFLVERGYFKGRERKESKEIGFEDKKRGAFSECQPFTPLIS